MTRGTVLHIQSYSLHDGPGIRTVVFLKGCPLRCVWCANPESQEALPQIYFDSAKCLCEKGCGRCADVCPTGAAGGGSFQPERCSRCGECLKICPTKALNVYGEELTADEVLDMVERERVFYRHGKGGLTLSGGEPLAQPDFTLALLSGAKERCLHTAMETCGYASTETLLRAARHLDYIMYDIKLWDEEAHIRYTGCSNRLILDNLKALFEEYPRLPKRIRTPVIPSVNDTLDEIGRIRDFLSQYENYSYELLPYHRFGEHKYKLLGRNAPDLPERLKDGCLDALKQYENNLPGGNRYPK